MECDQLHIVIECLEKQKKYPPRILSSSVAEGWGQSGLTDARLCHHGIHGKNNSWISSGIHGVLPLADLLATDFLRGRGRLRSEIL